MKFVINFELCTIVSCSFFLYPPRADLYVCTLNMILYCFSYVREGRFYAISSSTTTSTLTTSSLCYTSNGEEGLTIKVANWLTWSIRASGWQISWCILVLFILIIVDDRQSHLAVTIHTCLWFLAAAVCTGKRKKRNLVEDPITGAANEIEVSRPVRSDR